jgi:hypothetical protein
MSDNSVGETPDFRALCEREAERVRYVMERPPGSNLVSNFAFATFWCRCDCESELKMEIPVYIKFKCSCCMYRTFALSGA